MVSQPTQPAPASATSAAPAICVYCGSSSGRDPSYVAEGRALGRAIAEAGWRLVYGGGTLSADRLLGAAIGRGSKGSAHLSQ